MAPYQVYDHDSPWVIQTSTRPTALKHAQRRVSSRAGSCAIVVYLTCEAPFSCESEVEGLRELPLAEQENMQGARAR